MKTLRQLLALTVIAVLAVGAGVGVTFEKFLRTPLITEEQGLAYKVRLGASFKSVADDLAIQHILSHPYFFMWLVQYRHVVHNLKAGEYFFPKGTTPAKMISQVVTGTGMIYHAFTITPGTTFRQLRQALDSSNELFHATTKLSNTEIMTRLGEPNVNPEGMFFPDTYYFVVDSSDLTLLRRAMVAMQIKLNHAWEQRAANLPFNTPYQALTAASIIEKEARAKAELPIIAGVMVNRLHKDIILQFDPTVIYGMGTRYNGTIYKKDLLEETPYNSYVHKGLPPTPISMPGLAAINAVMHPDINNYLYFVARGDGLHQFSDTLAAHNEACAAAKKYHSGFFNAALVQHYLLKSFSLKQFSIN
jgi:UPF0755 protein